MNKTITQTTANAGSDADHSNLCKRIADSLENCGYYVGDQQLPAELVQGLKASAEAEQFAGFQRAAVGRGIDRQTTDEIRRDHVRWIHGDSPAEQQWLAFAEALQLTLNRELYLGLQSFESHFARYQKGDFYRRHRDAFRQQPMGQQATSSSVTSSPVTSSPVTSSLITSGGSNRAVSIVAYLNDNWSATDGGELLLYPDTDERDATGSAKPPLQRVLPTAGSLCVFLSEKFPHEVKAAERQRLSIAGWFRR